MVFHLDKKEQRILYALEKNGRATVSELAKTAGISKQLASYKLKHLEKERIILGYHAIIDTARLGYTSYRVYVKLKNCTYKERTRALKEISMIPEITHCVTLDHVWDGGLLIMVKNSRKFHEAWRTLMRFRNIIAEYDLCIYEPIWYFTRSFLDPDNKEEQEIRKIGEHNEVPHDQLDLDILKKIAPNVRRSLSKVAQEIGKPLQTIINRLREMERNGIIQGYRPVLNWQALGYEYRTAKMKLKSYDRINEMEQYATQIPFIFQIDKTAGNYDFELELYTRNLEHFKEIIDDFTTHFQEVESFDHFTVDQTFKEEYIPS